MIRKYLLLVFLTAVLFAAAAHPANAADNYLNMFGGIGAGYYYLYPKDIELQQFYKGGMAYRGFIGFRAESGLEVTGDIGYYSEGNRSPIAPYGTALTIIPVTTSVAYHPFNNSSISPYFGAGIGAYYINESDPDFIYVQAIKFGKQIFVGTDIYIDRSTVLRAELKQTFIDPVSSPLYYQATFGGLTATLNVAVELPFGGRTPLTTAEAIAQQQRNYAAEEHQAVTNRIDAINSYYDEHNWNRTIYQPWNSPDVYINPVIVQSAPTQQQIDEQKAVAAQKKLEQDQKRQDYLNLKQQLRQEKKDIVNPAR